MQRPPRGAAPEDDAPIPTTLRVMLVEWRRTRIAEANAIADLLGMPRVRVDRKADDAKT